MPFDSAGVIPISLFNGILNSVQVVTHIRRSRGSWNPVGVYSARISMVG